MTNEEKIQAALEMASDVIGIDGSHHKQWGLDQIVRILTGDNYAAFVTEWRDGEDGPETYSWDQGIAP